MPNTANYSFPTPADTDLVKNGADAIRDLGDAVDTAMNTALGTKKSGLVLLNTTSFSGVASQDIATGTFTSAYQNYRIIYMGTAGSGDLGMRLGTGGTFNTTANNYRYNFQYATYTATTISGAASSTTATSFLIGNAGFHTVLDLFSPFDSARNTSVTWAHARDDYGYMTGGGAMTVTTSYSQVRFFPLSGGNISGTIYVYGYNQ
jgi:hypothetical protein